MKVTYGKTTPTSATDPDIQQVHHFFEVFMTVVLPGAYLADSIPWLQYIPWYGRVLKDEFSKSKQLYMKQLKRVRQQIVCIALSISTWCPNFPQQSNEDVGPSFMKYVLENSYLYGLTEDEMAFLAGAFFGAGSDTVRCLVVLRTFRWNQVLDCCGNKYGADGSRMFPWGASQSPGRDRCGHRQASR
jgi:hypothetical protein